MKNVTKNILLLVGLMCVAENVHAMNGGQQNGHAKQVKTTTTKLQTAALAGDIKIVEQELTLHTNSITGNMCAEVLYGELLSSLISVIDLKLAHADGILHLNLTTVKTRLEQELGNLPSSQKDAAHEKQRQEELRQQREADALKKGQSGKCVLL